MSLGKWVVVCVVVGLGMLVVLWLSRPHQPAFESMDHSLHVKEQVRGMVPTLSQQADPAKVLDAFESNE